VELSRKYLTPLFNSLSDKRYDEAIQLAEIFRNFVETQNKLEKENKDLKRILKSKTNELAEYLTFLGYLKYKSRNIACRIKKRFKSILNNLHFKLNNITSNIKQRITEIKITLIKYNPWINFNELVIILPYRMTNDCVRQENLDICLRYLSHIGIKNLIITEHSDRSTKYYLTRNYANLFDSFQFLHLDANGELFNKAKAINEGVLEAQSKYIAIFDVDCLTKKENVKVAVGLLNNGYEVVHPFDRKVIDIKDKEMFIESFDFNTIKSTIQNRPWADGGIVFWNKNSFINIGMKNENFSGWGGEDNEIMIRADLFDLKQYRIEDTLYHLYHHRPQKRTKNNAKLLQKTQQMTKKLCMDEINNWPWVIKAKKG